MMETNVHNSDSIPTAVEKPVYVNGQLTLRYKAIAADNKLLSIVSSRYSIIQHRDVARCVEDFVLEHLDYRIERILLFQGGRKLLIELSTEDYIEVQRNDLIQKRCIVVNSYDTEKSLTVLTSGLRLVCRNGLIAPKLSTSMRKVHVFKPRNFSLDSIGEAIEAGIKAWDISEAVLTAAVTTTVDTRTVLSAIPLPRRYIDAASRYLPEMASVYEIWNEITRALTHWGLGNAKTLLEQFQTANKVFEFIPATTS